MMKLTSEAGYQHLLVQTDMEPVVEATFEWLISLVSAIAVQANCMDVLWNLRTRYNWVADELREQIGFLMKTGGPGIQVRGRKVLGKMRDVSGI